MVLVSEVLLLHFPSHGLRPHHIYSFTVALSYFCYKFKFFLAPHTDISGAFLTQAPSRHLISPPKPSPKLPGPLRRHPHLRAEECPLCKIDYSGKCSGSVAHCNQRGFSESVRSFKWCSGVSCNSTMRQDFSEIYAAQIKT